MFKDVYIQNGDSADLHELPSFSAITFWPAASINECQRSEQLLRLREGPTRPLPCFQPGDAPRLDVYSSAEAGTLRALWNLRASPARQLQLLRAAVLHEWVGNARASWPSEQRAQWPAKRVGQEAYQRALELSGIKYEPWRYPQVHCLPALPNDVERTHNLRRQDLRDILAFTTAIDARVLLFLDHWTPVEVHYGWRGNDILVAQLRAAEKKRLADEARAQAERKAAWAAEQAARDAHRAAMREQHCRWGDWPVADAEELRDLVWSKPLRDVAHDFGISDVAVKKACTARGIETPKRGYWLRAEQLREKR